MRDDLRITSKIQRAIFGKNRKKYYFNPKFTVGNITPEMWNFEIGGIKQLENWIRSKTYITNPKRSHKSLPRGLNQEEINDFQRICYVIKETLVLFDKIDRTYKS